jgi:hypothetical protein
MHAQSGGSGASGFTPRLVGLLRILPVTGVSRIGICSQISARHLDAWITTWRCSRSEAAGAYQKQAFIDGVRNGKLDLHYKRRPAYRHRTAPMRATDKSSLASLLLFLALLPHHVLDSRFNYVTTLWPFSSGSAKASDPRHHDRRAGTSRVRGRAAAPCERSQHHGLRRPKSRVEQREAYLDLQPLILNIPPPQAFERALATVREMRWDVVAADGAAGRIAVVLGSRRGTEVRA